MRQIAYIQTSKENTLQVEQKGFLKVCEFLDLYCMVCCFLPFQINPVWFGLMFYVTLCGGNFFRNKNLRGDFKESQSFQVFIHNSCSNSYFVLLQQMLKGKKRGHLLSIVEQLHHHHLPMKLTTYQLVITVAYIYHQVPMHQPTLQLKYLITQVCPNHTGEIHAFIGR